MKAKEKAIEYLYGKDCGQGIVVYEEKVVSKAIDIAIQEAKKEVFDDIDKYGCIHRVKEDKLTYGELKKKHL